MQRYGDRLDGYKIEYETSIYPKDDVHCKINIQSNKIPLHISIIDCKGIKTIVD